MTDRVLKPARAIVAALMMLGAMILAGLSTRASAQPFENLDGLDSLVAMRLGAGRGQPGGQIAPIDRRLRLAACPQTPQVDAPVMNAAIVSCPAIGWRIRVPVAAVQATPKSAPAAYAAAPAASNAVVVKKGDPVQLVAGNEEFSVSKLMFAEEDGAIGALIRVREDQKGAPVMARVEALGVVRIPGI